MGSSRDGVGNSSKCRITKQVYLKVHGEARPFSMPPILYHDPDFDDPNNSDMWFALYDSVKAMRFRTQFQITFAEPNSNMACILRDENFRSLDNQKSVAIHWMDVLAVAFDSRKHQQRHSAGYLTP